MKRAKPRIIVVMLLAIATLVSPHIAEAQLAKKVPRIAYLSSGSPSSAINPLLEGLRDLDYLDGQNIMIEYRYADGRESRLPELAADLARLKVDVIVAASTAAAVAVQKVTKKIPIVLTDSADPVGAGLVASLARPGGNVTGSSFMSPELATKQLELLKEITPGLSRVAVLGSNPNPTPGIGHLPNLMVTAEALGVQIEIVRVYHASQFENAFLEIAQKRSEALTLIAHPFFTRNRPLIVDLAARSRLPAMYPHRGYPEAGGLMSYGPDHRDLFRRAAYFVDKILRGTKPSELPVEQPTKFEFVVNLKTAKQIGITIPPDVLMWADEVIK